MLERDYKTMRSAKPIVLIGALLFLFLPMFNIKCSSPMGGSMTIAEVSGITLVTGGTIKVNSALEKQMKGIGKQFEDKDSEKDENKATPKKDDKDKSIKPNAVAIVSAVLMLAALVFCYVKIPNANLYTLLASGSAALALIFLAFTIKSSLMQGTTKVDADMDFGIIKTSPAIGYYLCLIATIAAVVISYLVLKRERITEANKLLMEEIEEQPLGDTSDVNQVAE
jgi:hypothetical protein